MHATNAHALPDHIAKMVYVPTQADLDEWRQVSSMDLQAAIPLLRMPEHVLTKLEFQRIIGERYERKCYTCKRAECTCETYGIYR